jgi:hypothetical protein
MYNLKASSTDVDWLNKKEQLIDRFLSDLEEADVIQLGNSPLLSDWDVDDDYVVTTSWTDDNGFYNIEVDLDTALEISKFAGTWKFTFEDYYEHFTLYSLNII